MRDFNTKLLFLILVTSHNTFIHDEMLTNQLVMNLFRSELIARGLPDNYN